MEKQRFLPKASRTKLVLVMDETGEKMHLVGTVRERQPQTLTEDGWLDIGVPSLDLTLDEPLGIEYLTKTGGVLLADGRSWSVFVDGDQLVKSAH